MHVRRHLSAETAACPGIRARPRDNHMTRTRRRSEGGGGCTSDFILEKRALLACFELVVKAPSNLPVFPFLLLSPSSSSAAPASNTKPPSLPPIPTTTNFIHNGLREGYVLTVLNRPRTSSQLFLTPRPQPSLSLRMANIVIERSSV